MNTQNVLCLRETLQVLIPSIIYLSDFSHTFNIQKSVIFSNSIGHHCLAVGFIVYDEVRMVLSDGIKQAICTHKNVVTDRQLHATAQ